MESRYDHSRRAEHRTTFARQLRQSMTDAERRLWSRLRRGRFGGCKFRRQQTIGPYIADFYSASAKLVIELDGSQHGFPDVVEHDKARTRWLEQRGYRVLRFFNVDVLKEIDGVLDTIYRHIENR